MRVAVLTEIISPYRIPVFNSLAAYPDIDLTVIFASETEALREWHVAKELIRFKYEVLPGRVIGTTYQNGSLFLNPTVIQRISQGSYDIVIFGGYHHPTYWIALIYCIFRRKTTILWSESTDRDFRVRSRIRAAIKRIIISAFHRYLVPGNAQANYLRAFGIEASSIWTAPNAVDTAYFANASNTARRQRDQIKESLGITAPVLLFVGRLTVEKGVGDLLNAFELVLRHGYAAHLIIVGSGPDEATYKRYANERNLPVVFAGFQQQKELPRFYGIADIFVFPTHSDPWGLVLNEAMSSGLPVVVSSAAGAVDDLVLPNQNGFVYTAGDVNSMSQYIEQLLKTEELRGQMGNRSLEIIQSFTPQNCAKGFYDAIYMSRFHSS